MLIRKFPCSIPMACVFIRQGCVKSVPLAPKQTPSPRHGQRPSGARATVWRVSLCTGKTPEHTKGRSERKIFRNASSCQLLLAVATCRKSRAKHVHFIKEMTWNSGPLGRLFYCICPMSLLGFLVAGIACTIACVGALFCCRILSVRRHLCMWRSLCCSNRNPS